MGRVKINIFWGNLKAVLGKLMSPTFNKREWSLYWVETWNENYIFPKQSANYVCNITGMRFCNTTETIGL